MKLIMYIKSSSLLMTNKASVFFFIECVLPSKLTS